MKKLELYFILVLFPLAIVFDYVGWNLMFRQYGYRSLLQCLKEDCATLIKQCNEAGVEDYKQSP